MFLHSRPKNPHLALRFFTLFYYNVVLTADEPRVEESC